MATSVVHEMRRARRRRRLGELEWFEIAYRVYLAALAGGVLIGWLSSLVSDEPVSVAQLADVERHGPGWIGALAVAAVALGLRSGSDGGPVSLEPGDARHLMMAPIPRRSVLLRPLVQRFRTMAFGGILVGGIAGQLAARRLPGSAPAWAASGAAAGALVGIAFVATAAVVHAARMPRWAATAAAIVLVAWQAAAVGTDTPGPGDSIGSLALWGMRTRPVDLAAVAVVLIAAVAAAAVCDRLRLEPLTRRADLVSQLRFAVTMQDLRTVVLLRRQLRGERPRTEPWFRLGRSGSASRSRAVWQRDLRGLARYPASRLVRMALLAVCAGLGVIAVESGTTPAMIAVGMVAYLLGLEAIEPMSQEIDHPDLNESVPVPRNWLLVRHLLAPAVGLVPFALIAAVVVIVADPSHAPAALALCVPVAWAGACGAVVSVVRDAPNPAKATTSAAATAVPPEFAGFTSSLRFLVPILVSTICSLTVLAMREAPSVGQAVRMALLNLLVVAATAAWIYKRDEWAAAWQRLLDGGKAERDARRGA